MTDLRTCATWIITPATAPERFIGAKAAGADVALVDLEDSVAPADKARARVFAEQFFTPKDDDGRPMGVRINAPGSPDGVRDLVALLEWPVRPELILVPKVESPRDIDLVSGILDDTGYAPRLLALVETPRGIEQAGQLVRAERLAGVVFGAADYAAAVGCRLTWDSMAYARAALVGAAAAAGLAAVDSPYFAMHDLDGLAEESGRARDLGYTGKGAVHPRQVQVIERAFRPTAEEIAAARAVLDAAASSGGAITSVDGAMLGRPFFAAAAALTARVHGGGGS